MTYLGYAMGSYLLFSVLEPPADEQRAIRVACPFDEPDKLPIAWGSLSVMFKGFK